MSLTAGQIIEAARFSHPAFDVACVPASVGARFVNEAQRRLLVAAHQRNPTYLVKRWVITLLPGQDVAQVGAGTGVGAPLVPGTTFLERETVNVGSAATVNPDNTVLVSERAATAATSNSLIDLTATWTINDYVGMLVEILAGTGAGQVRQILSNGTDTLVVPTWDQIPDTTSTFVITTNEEVVSGSVGVALGNAPQTSTVPSFLVLLDSAGQPYLDLSTPIQVPISLGIPLPPNYYVNHGLVRFLQDGNYPDQSQVLTLTSLDNQVRPPLPFCACIVGETLQLLRPFEQWRQVQSLELPYLPLAPTVTGANDLLILPDTAEEALVQMVALRMAERAKAMGRLGDPSVFADFKERSQVNESLYLDTVAGAGRALVSSVVSMW